MKSTYTDKQEEIKYILIAEILELAKIVSNGGKKKCSTEG